MKEMDRRKFLCKLAKAGAIGAGFSGLTLLNQGCTEKFQNLEGTLDQIGQYGQSFSNVYNSSSKALEDFTPEQEYYIGRTIGAVILSKYPPYTKKWPNVYLNTLGQTLAQFSKKPLLYDGYHFRILDTNEINAFATPSGLAFITRGLIHCCKDEDMLAAVLAHEIAHIQNGHGLKAIKQGRIADALKTAYKEGTNVFGETQIDELANTFEASVEDIVSTMVTKGYSRSAEREADAEAVHILRRTGYQPAALVAMLKQMEQRLKPGGLDFAATHPSPSNRISSLEDEGDFVMQPLKTNTARRNRFRSRLKGV